MSENLIALQNKFLGHGETVYDELSKLHAKQGYINDEDIGRIAKQQDFDMTLIGFLKADQFNIYAGEQRIET